MKIYCVVLSLALSCCCADEEPPDPPSIHLNSHFLPNQTEVTLTAGSAFNLSCHGNGSIYWSSTAFRLQYMESLVDPVKVDSSEPRHTGTYRCGYTNRSLQHLDTWVHLYVRDPADPSSVFVTTRKIPDVREGQDFLLQCLLTDPSVANLTLQLQTDAGGKLGALPAGMSMTFDPRRGALIRDLKRSFSGDYVCSGWKDGRQFRSQPIGLTVVPGLRSLPSVSISQDESVRLEGEKFEVTCLTSNPNHYYSITWTHPHTEKWNITDRQQYVNQRLYKNKTLTVSAVSQTHSGTYTCTGFSEAGSAVATTRLRVLDAPYLKIYLRTALHAKANTRALKGNEDLVANISSISEEVQGDSEDNSSTSQNMKREVIVSVSTKDLNGVGNANISGNSTVDVYEGRDVILTFETDSYPPIVNRSWTTPASVNNNNNSVYQESYTANGCRSEASLLLRRVRQEDRGTYSFHFSNSFFSGSQNIDLRIYRPPNAVVSMENDTLTCRSSGHPLPTILWYICPGIQDTCADVSSYQVSQANVSSQSDVESGEEETTHLSLPPSPAGDITVECVASNPEGESRRVFSPRKPQTLFTPALVGAVSAAAILLLLLMVVFYKWKQKPKYEIRWKIIESTNGNNYTFVDLSQLPYNCNWEFPRDKLRLGAVLGSGAFGKVVEATAYGLGSDDVTRVAVKMLKPSAHSEEREALMSELKILSHLGYHDNIVNLLGACTQGGPMLMITEYCSHGDLLNFLRAHAQHFMASFLSLDEAEGRVFYKNMANLPLRLRSDSGISCCSDYQEMQPILSPGETQSGAQTGSLSVGDLMRFSHQVAQGLDFLSTKNCIHRDVAARNVLLTDHCVAKICDFGLARDIRNDDSYIVQGNARLPVKWMAPESIFQCVYTVQSDVWSYGVLLWEIFSLGKSPYPNIAVDTHFYKMIKDGRHMTRPDFAPVEMYKLMTLCWSLEPTDRPTFKVIGQLINRLLLSTNDTSPRHRKQLYSNIDECGEEEEDEEVKGGETLKRGDEEWERRQRERHGNNDGDQPVMKNIYQLS